MATATMLTSTIRFGSLTVGNDFRNPVMLAREVATVDVRGDGRLEFSFGSAHPSG